MKNDYQFTFRLPSAIKAAADSEAARRGISVAAYIAQVLEQALRGKK